MNGQTTDGQTANKEFKVQIEPHYYKHTTNVYFKINITSAQNGSLFQSLEQLLWDPLLTLY